MSGSLVGVVDENTYRDANLVPDTEEEPSETGNQEWEEGEPVLRKMGNSDKGLHKLCTSEEREGNTETQVERDGGLQDVDLIQVQLRHIVGMEMRLSG